MSFVSGKHGWAHAQSPCPVCNPKMQTSTGTSINWQDGMNCPSCDSLRAQLVESEAKLAFAHGECGRWAKDFAKQAERVSNLEKLIEKEDTDSWRLDFLEKENVLLREELARQAKPMTVFVRAAAIRKCDLNEAGAYFPFDRDDFEVQHETEKSRQDAAPKSPACAHRQGSAWATSESFGFQCLDCGFKVSTGFIPRRATVMKKRKADAFADGMARLLERAKRQGFRTRKDIATFRTGYAFGFSDGLERVPFGGKPTKSSGEAGE